MTYTHNYQKRKNGRLFNSLEKHHIIQLNQLQNYIPLYKNLFTLNVTNYNSVNLNHTWYIQDIKETTENPNIVNCKLQNILNEKTISHKVFFKMAPLLDPYKYLVGKYNHTDPNLFNLPNLENNNIVHNKLLDPNNSSYIDGFFVYLTSMLLNNTNFIHGIDYYGSFLGIKNNYKINIIDDLDYLIKSDFFNKNKNVLFQVPEYSHLIDDECDEKLVPIKIHHNSVNSKSSKNISITSFKDELFEDIFINNTSDSNFIELEEVKDTDLSHFDMDDKKSTTLRSSSTCSSRTSHTHSNASCNEDNIENESLTDSNDDSGLISDDSAAENNEKGENESSSDDDDDVESSDYDEEVLETTIPKFPVQVICMENCQETFDELIVNNELSTDEWFSAFMQIIMILITYQKVFSFTHNDLHTNNVMYNKTSAKYVYYCYKKKYYKVPTFGRIFKIIDFGRSIYKFNNQVFCSDSFQPGGDASTQYNTEPYFNEKKPRLEPNYSFDLCRLACSIFDYVVDDLENMKQLEETNPVVKLIIEWCLDDNGLNVLYKTNGQERYPDFKLYKMIARFVHNHTPIAQLERPEFKKYIVQKNNIEKGVPVINIDEL